MGWVCLRELGPTTLLDPPGERLSQRRPEVLPPPSASELPSVPPLGSAHKVVSRK